MGHPWQFWIDRGGTFTDIIGVAPDGGLHVRKVLSSQTGTSDPGIAAISEMLRGHGESTRASTRIEAVKVGTTVGTNALLERKGEPVLLVTTAGFADALRIGYQNRPDIFARHIVLPDRLYSAVVEARERIDVAGEVVVPLDASALRTHLLRARKDGFRAVAIVFLHAWQHAQHEREAAGIARSVGFEEVSVSHELSPLVRYVARGDTTVLNAYLAMALRQYVSGLSTQLKALDPHARLELMQSHGGLAAPENFHAVSSLLSGPAGGLIGMAHIGNRLGMQRLIGFDMGGTSTDVSLLDGELPRRFEHTIGGVRLQTSMLDVHTIAAGGGSILRFADARLGVGPESAGAEPGPACYGRDGPLTLTDVQVLLGRLRPDTLPDTFGADGKSCIDAEVVTRRFEALTSEIAEATGTQPSLEALAESFLEIGVEAMANAIRHVSVRQGLDAGNFTLFCFGGAAGQHACRVARAAGMRRVLVHPLASVLSAYGVGVADRLAVRRSSVRVPLSEDGLARAAEKLSELEEQARTELAAFGMREDQPSVGATQSEKGVTQASRELSEPEEQSPVELAAFETPGNPPSMLAQLSNDGLTSASKTPSQFEHEARDQTKVDRLLEVRAGDSETTLTIAAGPLAEVLSAFAAAHRQRFGFEPSGIGLVIEAVRIEARCPSINTDKLQVSVPTVDVALPDRVRAWFGEWRSVPLIPSHSVSGPVTGPALIVEPNSTVVVEAGWTAQRLPGGELLLEAASTQAAHTPDTLAAPARIEIFNNLFMHIAEQMGEVLKHTAQSVNIKERLDYSCALFDASGGLVANAPHMPVHLGSMGASVQAVIDKHGSEMQPGDSWLLNSPYHGGTHLPDMTVVTPVFFSHGGNPDFFVASRAHHADIGGTTPGSMPPFSSHIEEEGVLFEDFKLVHRGRFRERELRDALNAPPYPSRKPDQNVADLRAQLAANARGIAELERAVARHGIDTVREMMKRVQDNAATCVRNAIARLQPGAFRVEMDGGQVIAVRIDIDHAARRARIDFTGTSAQGPHNFNAPRAVCLAAVLYVFRTLVDRPIPLNEGCSEPLDIVIPSGSMLDPVPPAAVAAGNVETSQCIVDALYGALGVLAASQGTMNNLTFGNERLQYYETIAGGSGAGPGFDGCDAVQTHMTNSRLTDPEILEAKFPVMLREFSIRRGSGGAGRYRGGDGVVRRLLFREPLSGALLANRRRIAPFGLEGGASAAPGAGRITRASGATEELGATARFDVAPGDELTILTPGGGGYGTA